VRWLAVVACVVGLQANAHEGHADLLEARRLRNGDGVAVDKAHAARLFERAAQAGDADAAFLLANMLRDGEGVPQDRLAAQRWLLQAAAGESPEALQQLAMEEPDPARAAQLFKEAAHALKHQTR
jgi:TPR repeat protein